MRQSPLSPATVVVRSSRHWDFSLVGPTTSFAGSPDGTPITPLTRSILSMYPPTPGSRFMVGRTSRNVLTCHSVCPSVQCQDGENPNWKERCQVFSTSQHVEEQMQHPTRRTKQHEAKRSERRKQRTCRHTTNTTQHNTTQHQISCVQLSCIVLSP